MKFKMISARDLKGYLDREDILLFDLRERSDYEKGHIGKAVWEDWERLENRIDGYLERAAEQIHWIILYCDKGNTSLLVARDLARMGYPVMSVNGGYAGWERLNA